MVRIPCPISETQIHSGLKRTRGSSVLPHYSSVCDCIWIDRSLHGVQDHMSVTLDHAHFDYLLETSVIHFSKVLNKRNMFKIFTTIT